MAGLELLAEVKKENDEAERAEQRRLDDLARSVPRRLGALDDPYREGVPLELWRACQ